MARWGKQAYNPNIPSCYLIIENGRGEWLFVLRQNTGYKDGDFGLLGGNVELGEPLDRGAIREGLEEAGVKVDDDEISFVHICHRDKVPEVKPDGSPIEPRLDSYFRANRWSGEPTNLEDDLHAELAWLHPDSLPTNVVDFQAAAIAAIRQGKFYSRYGEW